MEALELKAEARDGHGHSAKELRRQGLVPGVVYGRGIETEQVQIDAKSLQRVLSIAGTHQLISLQIGQSRPRLTLAREIQRDPVKRHYLHVDFYAVKMDEKVRAEIPIVLKGEAPAVEELDGIVTHGLDELEIECLPSDLVNSIEVDISGLANLNDTITVADLKVPETITVLSDPDSMVVKIEAPRTAESLEALEAEMAAPSAEPERVGKREAEEDEDEDEA
jgi:large subunit ribosomal protein L25